MLVKGKLCMWLLQLVYEMFFFGLLPLGKSGSGFLHYFGAHAGTGFPYTAELC